MFHPSPDEFAGASAEYGSFGRAAAALSRLEYQNDLFILAVRNREPSFACHLSRRFPRQFREKTDFTIRAIAAFPELRKIPIGGIFLDLHWLGYQLDELGDVRNATAHGAVTMRNIQDRGTIWKSERVLAGKKVLEGVINEMGNGFLVDVFRTASSIRIHLHWLDNGLTREYDPETAYEVYKESTEQGRVIEELIELGVIR